MSVTELLSDPDLRMRTVVSGKTGFDAEYSWQTSGTFDVDADAFHLELDSAAGPGPGIVSMGLIRTGGRTYARPSPGVWQASKPNAVNDSLRDVLQNLAGGTIGKPVTVNGRSLRQVVLVDQHVPYAALNFELADTGAPGMSLVALVDQAGKPVQLRLEQQASGAPLVDLTFAITSMGNPVSIDAPALWTTYESSAGGYEIAHPDDWTVDPGDGNSVRLTGKDGSFCDVFISKDANLTLESWAGGGVAAIEKELGAKELGVEQWQGAGASPSGWLATWQITSGDQPGNYLYAAFVDGRGRGYDVKWFSPITAGGGDRKRFEAFLGSLVLKN